MGDSLKELYKRTIRANYEAMALDREYQAALMRERGRLCVPVGYDVDVLGDGTVKPIEQCAKVLKADG